MIGALCLLLGCDLAGEALRGAARLPVPGPVIGMLLLTVILLASPRKAARPNEGPDPASPLGRVCDTLISHMGVLFVPAGVGVISQLPVLRTEWLPILGGLLGSTLLGLIVTALVMQRALPPVAAAQDAPAKGAAG